VGSQSLSFGPVTSYSSSCPILTPILQIKRAISSWVHKFADTAEKALGTEFTRQGLQTPEERTGFVQHLLGNADDMSDKRRPFIWETAYNDPEARQEVSFQLVMPRQPRSRPSFQGIFQGRLIARTLFEHIQIIKAVDPKYRVQEKPVGALIYSIQAVRFHSLCRFCLNVWVRFIAPSFIL
jgi:hypothetical protein